MGGAAAAGRSIGQARGPALRVRNQVLEAAHRQRAVGHQQDRRIGEVGDPGEILDRIEWHALVQARVHDVVVGQDHERVAIRGGFGDDRSAGHAVGAGRILDHHLLLP